MAAAALAGIDVKLWFDTDDDVEMALLNKVALRAVSLHAEYRQELADRIISALDKALKRGKKGKK